MQSLLICAAAALLPATPGLTDKSATDTYETPPGRLSFVEGEVFLRGPFDRDSWPVTENTIVREADLVATGPRTHAELELGQDNFLRLAAQSTVVIEEVAEQVVILLLEGSVYVSRGHGVAPVSVLMPNSFSGADDRVGIGPGSMARVDRATELRPAQVRIVAGWGELQNGGELVVLKVEAVRTLVADLWLEDDWDPRGADSFDHWNQEREGTVRGYRAPPFLAQEHYPGLYDLHSHGEWIVMTDGRMAWRPLGVAPDWRPYQDGYWRWVDAYGWTWVSFPPWGYVTHHYGRWLHYDDNGWVWLPGTGWAPAWVAWATAGSYVGWAPVDYLGRPVMGAETRSHYDALVWVFAYTTYFADGGGPWPEAHPNPGTDTGGQWHQGDPGGPVAAATGGAAHPRRSPFVSFTAKEIVSLEVRPIPEPRVALEPQGQGPGNILKRFNQRPARELGTVQPVPPRSLASQRETRPRPQGQIRRPVRRQGRLVATPPQRSAPIGSGPPRRTPSQIRPAPSRVGTVSTPRARRPVVAPVPRRPVATPRPAVGPAPRVQRSTVAPSTRRSTPTPRLQPTPRRTTPTPRYRTPARARPAVRTRVPSPPPRRAPAPRPAVRRPAPKNQPPPPPPPPKKKEERSKKKRR